MLGIALGRSEYTNGMVFYNYVLDSFRTLADHLLDQGRNIGDVFPSIRYDELKQDQKVTLLHQNMYRRGYLLIGKENLGDFVIRNRDSNDVDTIPIADIVYS